MGGKRKRSHGQHGKPHTVDSLEELLHPWEVKIDNLERFEVHTFATGSCRRGHSFRRIVGSRTVLERIGLPCKRCLHEDLEDKYRTAAAESGCCLESVDWEGRYPLILSRCNAAGHLRRHRQYEQLRYQCKQCSRWAPLKEQDVKRFTEEKGIFELVSFPEGCGTNKKAHVRCKEGHNYLRNVRQLMRTNRCTGCYKLSEEDFIKLAWKRGIKFLGDKVYKSDERAPWGCNNASCGKLWEARYDNIASGSGCPHCSGSIFKGEERCRIILESIFKKPFPNSKPLWMRNPFTGYLLELDAYNEELALALEHQGPHHNNADQQARDAVKKQICKEKGVALLVVWAQPSLRRLLSKVLQALEAEKLPFYSPPTLEEQAELLEKMLSV